MEIFGSISRLTAYCKRHGFFAALRRMRLGARRMLFAGRMVLFYCDLPTSLSRPEIPGGLNVDRYRRESDLRPLELQEIINVWNADLACRNIKLRFQLGASLWLIRVESKLAGYGWTLQGRTVEPHYFQLGEDDVHLFDFHVFPEFRGRGLNPLLVTEILRNLVSANGGRAFIEAREWNTAQLSSLKKTPFRRLGLARKMTIFHRTLVYWTKEEVPLPSLENALPKPASPAGTLGLNAPH